MDGFLPIFFLLVVLKIPVLGALWLIWWASKAPEVEGFQDDSNGGFNPRGPFPTRPRGPHGGSPALPKRVRARPAELVSDRRERVPTDGHGPPYTRLRSRRISRR
jgi:hypothetical protein